MRSCFTSVLHIRYSQIAQKRYTDYNVVINDTTDNSITWTIGNLKPGESATYTYRLTLKDTFDSSIIGKNLPTNEKITITYKENDKDGKPVEDTRCPVDC